jgi:RHS repeat-associated protein
MAAKVDPATGYFWYYKDHLGSTRQLGSSNLFRDYYPFGISLAESGTETAYLFTGKELDYGSGLSYSINRYLDQRIGRWWVPDPLAGKYPQWSPYVYCFNNPIKLVDPDGMEIIGNEDHLKKLSEQLNNALNKAGIKDASSSVVPIKDKDGNVTNYKLQIEGTGWNDLANGDQVVSVSENANTNKIATLGFNKLSDLVRSDTKIDFRYSNTTSDGKRTSGGGFNSKGRHIAVDPGKSFGVSIHELMHSHPDLTGRDVNNIGIIFGNPGNRWHDDDRSGYAGRRATLFGYKMLPFHRPATLSPTGLLIKQGSYYIRHQF